MYFFCNGELTPWYHQKVTGSLYFHGSLSWKISVTEGMPNVKLSKPLRGFWVLLDLSFKRETILELGFSPMFFKKENFSSYFICCVFSVTFKWSHLKAYKSYFADLNLKYWCKIFSAPWLKILFLHISDSYFHIILPTECVLKMRIFFFLAILGIKKKLLSDYSL